MEGEAVVALDAPVKTQADLSRLRSPGANCSAIIIIADVGVKDLGLHAVEKDQEGGKWFVIAEEKVYRSLLITT